jgi:hypothetical protein
MRVTHGRVGNASLVLRCQHPPPQPPKGGDQVSAETVKQIVLAALEAAKAIAKVTPNDLDNRIAAIAEVIVNEVFGLLSSGEGELDGETVAAAKAAAADIKTALQ